MRHVRPTIKGVKKKREREMKLSSFVDQFLYLNNVDK